LYWQHEELKKGADFIMCAVLRVFGVLGLIFLFTGCSTPRTTNTARSYTEELLISTAADKGISKMKFEDIAGKKVFVDFSNLKSVDQNYIQGIILTQLGAHKLKVIKDKKAAELIVEPFCGALATNSSSWLLGIPAITVPIPLAGPVSTPEIALFKTITQDAVGKFGIRISTADKGEQIHSKLNVVGTSYYNRYSFIGIPWTTTDIPALD
jgi:hypothetical protein